MPRIRTARTALVWNDTDATVVGRYYIYETDGEVYKALTATTNVPPTGATDANYELQTETDQFMSATSPVVRKPKHHETDWWLWKVARLLEEWTAANFSVALYASMSNDATGIGSIGAGWTPITTYTRDNFTPNGITTDLAAGTLSFPFAGIYRLGAYVNLQHDESNQGRETFIRFYNVTDGQQEGTDIPIGIARNQPATNFTIYPLFEITEALKNKALRMEIGGGSTITVVTFSVDFEASMVSEWKEPLP